MPPSATVERRRDVRHPASFAFWVRREAGDSNGAFMLNWSAGGAAFLAEAWAAPHPGERVRLSEMVSAASGEAPAGPPLPRDARVVRVDDPFSELRRIAVRFESRVDARLEARLSRQALRRLSPPTACGLPAPT